MAQRALVGILLLIGAAAACSSSSDVGDSIVQSHALLTACTAPAIQIADLHADFKDIWAGRETTDTGKQADPNPRVTVDFSTSVDPSRVAAQFAPVATDGSCGATVAATQSSSVIGTSVWGSTASDSARPAAPGPYNVMARESISGVVSSAGAIAAGGDITLSGVSVNGTVRQPVGIIAGGKVVLANGSVQGNVTFGSPSTIPNTVSVSGTKTQQAFSVGDAFDNLEALSGLLAEEAPTGTVQTSNGTLLLNGTRTGLNVFAVSADAIQSASSLQITVPSGAGVLVNVTGPSVTFESKGVTLQGVASSGLLWNLSGSSFVRVASIGLSGSVFAPAARVTFESGSITGTIVARNFQSPGSGSLLSAPLNVALLVPSSTPSAVRLNPAQPLVRGCTYQFVIPATQPLTSGSNCLASDLRVTFRVAPHASIPASRELAAATGDPALKTLRRFQAQPGINTPVADIWARYEGAIGVPRSQLVQSGTPRLNPTRAGQLLTTYQQYQLGVPIAGFGYLVAMENGIFRSADGRVAPNLPTSLPTPISATAALQSATRFLKIQNPPWLANPTKYHPPITTLALIPQSATPSTADAFRLLWDIRLIGTGVTEPAGVQVDAATGSVVNSYPATVNLTFLDPAATYQNQQVQNSVDTLYGDGSQPITVASYRDSTRGLVTTLSSAKEGSPGSLNVEFQSPPLSAGAPLPNPVPIIDPSPNTPWTADDVPAENMATAFWGLQRGNAYLTTLGFVGPGSTVPWTSIDGVGHKRLMLRYAQDATTESNAGYTSQLSDADTVTFIVIEGMQGAPVDRAVIPHEFGHAFLANIRQAAGLTPDLINRYQSGSINEALGDLYALASVHSQLGEPASWSTITKTGSPLRDVLNPPHTVQPDYYLGTNFDAYTGTPVPCTGGTTGNDFCSVHKNSTVLSHLGYMLAFGSAAVPDPNPCGLSVQSLDADPNAAFKRLLTIDYNAAGTRLGFPILVDEPTFADFRDATLSVSQDLIATQQAPSDTTHKLELGFYAVGLGPQFLSAVPNAATSDAHVTPLDDSSSVNPWQTFSWPVNGDGMQGTAWDFQIADGPFDTNLKYEASNITDTFTRNGTALARLALALPFESTSSFFWRVRPHSTGPWLGCFPVHTFKGTGQPLPIENLRVLQTLAPDGTTVLPGAMSAGAKPVEGALHYRAGLATQDVDCGPGDDSLDAPFFEGIPVSGAVSTVGIARARLPNQHYWMHVRAVGPNDFAGNESLGTCSKLQFDTASLPTPQVVTPPSNDSSDNAFPLVPLDPNGPGIPFSELKNGFAYSFFLGQPKSFVWFVPGGTKTSELSFFEKDENGVCQIVPARVELIDTPCNDPNTCFQRLDNFVIAPKLNPTGYCWSVVAIADNGARSPASKMLEFRYAVGHSQLLSPGAFVGTLADLFGTVANSGPLSNDAWGKDVTFSWDADPLALKYKFRLWHWERLPLAPDDPPGCANTFFSCAKTPLHILVEQVVDGTSITVKGNIAAQGRYGWVIWPLIEDPKVPGTVGPRQPLVDISPSFSYTAPPAPPVITVDNPPAATGFSSAPITGHVHFAYVPANQWDVSFNTPDGHLDGTCATTADALVFPDVYNCDVPFSIAPQPKQTYTITAKTWNSSVLPVVMDDRVRMPDVTQTLTTGSCGASGQPCCDNNTCDDPGKLPGLTCQAGKCNPCGELNSQCCPGNQCETTHRLSSSPPIGTGVSCQAGTCSECGNANQICCPASLGIGPCPGTQVFNDRGLGASGQCVSNRCTACGHAGESCCPNNVNGPICTGSLACNQGVCGSASGGGGGMSCPTGTLSCGNSPCIDPFATPSGAGWEAWRQANPSTPAVLCINNTWFCDTSLDSEFTPAGVVSLIANGTAVCCPPGTLGVTGLLCIEDNVSDPFIDDP